MSDDIEPMIEELEQENRLLRARNERLENALKEMTLAFDDLVREYKLAEETIRLMKGTIQ